MRKLKEKKLTNEHLAGFFDDKFELAIYAIRTAQHRVHDGAETTMSDVLDEIYKYPPEKGLRRALLEKEALSNPEETEEVFSSDL